LPEARRRSAEEMVRRKEACGSVLGFNLCFGSFPALSKATRVRGCAFNMNIQTGVEQHELLRIVRKGVDALQELATFSPTSARSQRKHDRQVAQLHAALVTIHDAILEQTVSKDQGNCRQQIRGASIGHRIKEITDGKWMLNKRHWIR
jgi:hypothetical protein